MQIEPRPKKKKTKRVTSDVSVMMTDGRNNFIPFLHIKAKFRASSYLCRKIKSLTTPKTTRGGGGGGGAGTEGEIHRQTIRARLREYFKYLSGVFKKIKQILRLLNSVLCVGNRAQRRAAFAAVNSLFLTPGEITSIIFISDPI